MSTRICWRYSADMDLICLCRGPVAILQVGDRELPIPRTNIKSRYGEGYMHVRNEESNPVAILKEREREVPSPHEYQIGKSGVVYDVKKGSLERRSRCRTQAIRHGR